MNHKKWLGALAALLVGITAAAPGTAPAAEPATPVGVFVPRPKGPTNVAGWRLYGCYRSYRAACDAARYLRSCGYDTCIECKGRYYEVWYYCCY